MTTPNDELEAIRARVLLLDPSAQYVRSDGQYKTLHLIKSSGMIVGKSETSELYAWYDVVKKTPAQQLSMMIVLAAEHVDDVDNGGMPYILHPLKVAHYLKTDDLILMVIATGHDLVEDHGKTVTYRRLREMGFEERAVLGIDAVTRRPGETEDEYVARVLASYDGCRVKRQDLRHNSDLRRLKSRVIGENDIKRTLKYQRFYVKVDNKIREYERVQ